ncbi:hypothetical protein GCM10011332_29450 [Terasakiella brassicae]|uniref:Uncharacterized protein n=1 Tax=Terasakiella brassicae TaxID=1634917 RepID=A0A917C6S2_9PROT|nr:hypothetical protein [Terasakiella brassicae]GGF73493.1 hypothetical protein GCM10011332_29450 [Terasakiella brassicae]
MTFYEDHAANIARKYPHCFCLESKLISAFERLDNAMIPHQITDGIGLTCTRETLREERQMFDSYQIYVHAKNKSDLDSLMALV